MIASSASKTVVTMQLTPSETSNERYHFGRRSPSETLHVFVTVYFSERLRKKITELFKNVKVDRSVWFENNFTESDSLDVDLAGQHWRWTWKKHTGKYNERAVECFADIWCLHPAKNDCNVTNRFPEHIFLFNACTISCESRSKWLKTTLVLKDFFLSEMCTQHWKTIGPPKNDNLGPTTKVH